MNDQIRKRAEEIQNDLRERFTRKEMSYQKFCQIYDAIDEIAGTVPAHKGSVAFSMSDIEQVAEVVQL